MYERRNLKKSTTGMKVNKKKIEIFKDDDSNDENDRDVDDENNSDNEYKGDMLENRIKTAHW